MNIKKFFQKHPVNNENLNLSVETQLLNTTFVRLVVEVRRKCKQKTKRNH